jgi:hypothetical protein
LSVVFCAILRLRTESCSLLKHELTVTGSDRVLFGLVFRLCMIFVIVGGKETFYLMGYLLEVPEDIDLHQ